MYIRHTLSFMNRKEQYIVNNKHVKINYKNLVLHVYGYVKRFYTSKKIYSFLYLLFTFLTTEVHQTDTLCKYM